jgi:hypothetical protein
MKTYREIGTIMLTQISKQNGKGAKYKILMDIDGKQYIGSAEAHTSAMDICIISGVVKSLERMQVVPLTKLKEDEGA